tara:strand:- start:920 stop:2344 length:1425 start_codon:yes stop_codon:yes gene_type:complete
VVTPSSSPTGKWKLCFSNTATAKFEPLSDVKGKLLLDFGAAAAGTGVSDLYSSQRATGSTLAPFSVTLQGRNLILNKDSQLLLVAGTTCPTAAGAVGFPSSSQKSSALSKMTSSGYTFSFAKGTTAREYAMCFCNANVVETSLTATISRSVSVTLQDNANGDEILAVSGTLTKMDAATCTYKASQNSGSITKFTALDTTDGTMTIPAGTKIVSINGVACGSTQFTNPGCTASGNPSGCTGAQAFKDSFAKPGGKLTVVLQGNAAGSAAVAAGLAEKAFVRAAVDKKQGSGSSNYLKKSDWSTGCTAAGNPVGCSSAADAYPAGHLAYEENTLCGAGCTGGDKCKACPADLSTLAAFDASSNTGTPIFRTLTVTKCITICKEAGSDCKAIEWHPTTYKCRLTKNAVASASYTSDSGTQVWVSQFSVSSTKYSYAGVACGAYNDFTSKAGTLAMTRVANRRRVSLINYKGAWGRIL